MPNVDSGSSLWVLSSSSLNAARSGTSSTGHSSVSTRIWPPLTLISRGRSPNSRIVIRIPGSVPSTSSTAIAPARAGSLPASASCSVSVVQFPSSLIVFSVALLGMIGTTPALRAVSQSFRAPV